VPPCEFGGEDDGEKRTQTDGETTCMSARCRS